MNSNEHGPKDAGATEERPQRLTYAQFIEQNRNCLLGLYLLAKASHGRMDMETPRPPSELSEEVLTGLKDRLNNLIPLNTWMTDLWNWDVHFEEELDEDWYFKTVFGTKDSAEDCAEVLADYFVDKVDEYDMDYHQSNDFEAFKELVFDEALEFVTSWRRRIVEQYAGPDV